MNRRDMLKVIAGAFVAPTLSVVADKPKMTLEQAGRELMAIVQNPKVDLDTKMKVLQLLMEVCQAEGLTLNHFSS